MEAVFTADELTRLEKSYPEGLSVSAVLDLLRQRGVSLAEATFRKYVQLGLLPRSRRVGRKGKHRGSHGLYPVSVVGRLTQIRQLMDGGLTLEEIQRSAVAFANEVESVRSASETLLTRLEEEVRSRAPQRSATAAKRLQQLRTQAEALVGALEAAAEELCPATATEVAPEPPIELKRETERGRRPTKLAAAGRVGRKKSGTRPAGRQERPR